MTFADGLSSGRISGVGAAHVVVGAELAVAPRRDDDGTVVGVPGRLVRKHDKADKQAEEKRHATAEKLGFDAYGATKEAPDPVATAINRMLDHIHVMDEKMQSMCAALKQLGTEIDVSNLPDLGPCEIHSVEKEVEAEPEKIEGE